MKRISMNKNISFNIEEHLCEFIEERAALRAALIEGEQSGSSTPFDFETFIERKRAASREIRN
jgi:Arc/MetJ-type ribon-helix-helix transcriptional regulator